jgi:hypothetical protein
MEINGMINIRNFIFILTLILSPLSHAGLSSYSNSPSNGGVVAPILIDEQGMYNLAISVEFMREPFDRGQYDSDEYRSLISRLSTQWKGIAVQKVLDSTSIPLSSLTQLKRSVETAIDELIKSSKAKYGIKKSIEVVYAVNGFYLLAIEKD